MISAARRGDGILRIKAALDNPEPVMRAIAQLLESEVRQNFETETDPWGTPWLPLSEATLKLKAKGGIGAVGVKLDGAQLAGNKILRDSGALAGGIVPTHTRRRATVKASGPATSYAAAQQFGNPENKMPKGQLAPLPARPFLPIRPDGTIDLPEPVLEDIRDLLRQHLRRKE